MHRRGATVHKSTHRLYDSAETPDVSFIRQQQHLLWALHGYIFIKGRCQPTHAQSAHTFICKPDNEAGSSFSAPGFKTFVDG